MITEAVDGCDEVGSGAGSLSRIWYAPQRWISHAKPMRTLTDPLGARALYIFQDGRDTLYRVHGTNDPATIGVAVSSGCVRLLNQDVIDLYNRVPVGSQIVVQQAV